MLPLLFLFSWVICCQGAMEGSQSFIILQISHFWDPSSVQFWGNASLGGLTTHTLEGSGHNITIQQLKSLESPEHWKQTKGRLLNYLSQFQGLVQVVSKERKVAFPLTLRCNLGCELPPDGKDAHVFFEVALNGSSFVSFQPEKVLWSASPDQSYPPELYNFTLKQLNNYDQTRFQLLEFLQDTCVGFLKQHMKVFSKPGTLGKSPLKQLSSGLCRREMEIRSLWYSVSGLSILHNADSGHHHGCLHHFQCGCWHLPVHRRKVELIFFLATKVKLVIPAQKTM